MSNDRLYLRCKKCGEHKLLLKYYPTGSHLWEPDKLCDWMDLHWAACHNAPPELGNNPRFDLLTEEQLIS
jgi:hypothetical protein